jgi:hypothetical protein
MSINALKEFLVHFHTYRNIDLINQGLYQIRCRIFYTDNNNIKNYAIPYFFSHSQDIDNFQKNTENNIRPHNIISNHISENNCEYVTKTFLIRYYDEEVEIDEFCYFRLELPSDLINSKITYNVEFELFFSDALLALDPEKKSNNQNSTNTPNKNNGKSTNNVLNNAEFKSASKQITYIHYDSKSESAGFIQSFIPIIYCDSFLSILNTSLHMVILDYKLRLNNFSAFSCKNNNIPIGENNLNLNQNQNLIQGLDNNNNQNLNQGNDVQKKNNNQKEKNEDNLNINNFNLNKIEEGKIKILLKYNKKLN